MQKVWVLTRQDDHSIIIAERVLEQGVLTPAQITTRITVNVTTNGVTVSADPDQVLFVAREELLKKETGLKRCETNPGSDPRVIEAWSNFVTPQD